MRPSLLFVSPHIIEAVNWAPTPTNSEAGDREGVAPSVHRGGRILGLDVGTRRIGLAVSDGLGITAQGLPTLQRTRLDDDLEKIREVAEEYSTERVLVGNPLGHGGGETAMSRQAAEFAEKLRRRVTCPVLLWDERLTSVEANRALRDSGLTLGKRRRAVDRVAATLLLQSYLDFLANERSRNTGAAP